MKITLNELKDIRNKLPAGSIAKIARILDLEEQTVRNYFGIEDYEEGKVANWRVNPSPDEEIVELERTDILKMAKNIIEKRFDASQAKTAEKNKNYIHEVYRFRTPAKMEKDLGSTRSHEFQVEVRKDETKDLLYKLVGEKIIVEKIKGLFPKKLEVVKGNLKFNSLGDCSFTDYAIFLSTIDYLYDQFLSLSKVEYFVTTWLQEKEPIIHSKDRLILLSIKKNSPGEAVISAAKPAIQALSELLSIGKQIQSIGEIRPNLKKKKLEIREKEIQIQQLERDAKLKGKLDEIRTEIEYEKAEVELEKLKLEKMKLQEEQRKVLMSAISEKLQIIANTLEVLKKFPEPIREQFSKKVLAGLEELYSLPIQLETIEILE